MVAAQQNTEAIEIIVANNADSGNGTLRQAIQFNESLGGGNTILFSNVVTGTMTLTNALGELLITKDVTIIGPGAKVLTISGNNAHRVFHVTNASVSISGLYIASGSGAGIRQESGTLMLSDCIFSGNIAASAGAASGGAILASGILLATRCTFFENFAIVAGAGVFSAGTFTAVNCTFFNNTVGNGGGGGGGGGIYSAGNLFVTNCTIIGNYCGPNGDGGGIHRAAGTATIRNTIIANNSSIDDGPDCFGAFTSAGFNLIGAINGGTGWGALGDQFGTTSSYLNPLLGALQNNGGPTPTMAPQPGSPVIDQGNTGGIFVDQRGRRRPHTNDYISSIPLGGDRSDIGAVELSPVTLIVSNLNNSGIGSLRQTILEAGSRDGDTIAFASNVTGTIELTNGELVVGKSLTIQGPAIAAITVSGNNASRVFRVTGSSSVNVSSLTIANGNTAAQGAGFYNDFGCTLALSNCAVVANISGNNGGGVANNGSFAAYNCTFASNSAAYTGGGIYTYAGPVALRNCTVVSNRTAIAHGGGLCNYSLVAGTSNYITSTLVAGNSAPGHADVIGVFTSGGYNLIGKIDYSTPPNDGGASANVPTSGLTNGVNHDQVGSTGVPIDPKIGSLKNNGGPTPTMAALSNSPAIDKGISNGLLTDQRGAPRPFDFGPIPNAGGGDGSDVGAFELGSPLLGIQKSTTNVIISWPSYYGDFILQSVTNLAASTIWVALPGTPVVVGSHFNVTNNAVAETKFYRLKNN